MNHHPATLTAPVTQRGSSWKVTAHTINGQRYHYSMETERDADLLAIALQTHSKEIAETEVRPLSTSLPT